ncbi:hypothetical protein ACODT3_42545 [Streptomyces sp. 4.24]|uniref:hypothetical protein n=1 Tax=Streptomyces tritrimontium TaxID=3406573 RepID=UPI003BB5BACA
MTSRPASEHIAIRVAEERLIIAVMDPHATSSPLRRALAHIHRELPNHHTPGARP